MTSFLLSEGRSRTIKCDCPVGSDASAAGGRKSELSEWQRSKNSRISVCPMNLSGTATGLSQPPWLARRRASPFEDVSVQKIGINREARIATPVCALVRNDR